MTDYLHALPSGYRIEEYELVRVLGSGGFGITYLGYDHHLDKAVAIKEYLPNDLAVRADNQSVLPKSTQDKADYEWGLARFLTEAQTLARFDHRHIIKIHRFFRAHGTGYSVMEYAEGETLSALLQRKGTLTEAALKQLLFPILDGLEAVHRADFLHRDIKPGNIVIRDDGSPVLIDFGSARQAVAGKSRSVTAIVTPGYAPIEQYSAKGHQGPWTDIYGLGAVCYRCLTGDVPDDATERLREDPLVSAAQRCMGKASVALLGAIDRAIEVDEDARPQGVAEWRQALADGGKSRERTTRSAHKPVARSAKGSAMARTGMSWLSMALVALIVVLLGASAWQGWHLYRRVPGEDNMVTVVEQQADTRTGSQTDVALDTQAGNEVEAAAPGTAGTGAGQPAAEPGASPPAEEEDEVTRLLVAAEADITARRLTSPVGNNAWEKYQRVLELAPAYPEAMAGIERVIGSYLELFGSAVEQEEFDKAATYLSRIRDLRPDSPVLEEGERRLEAARQAREERLAEKERQRIEQVIRERWEAFDVALNEEDLNEAAGLLAQVRDLDSDAPGLADGERRLAGLERKRKEAEARARQFAREMVSLPGGTFRMGDLSGDGYAGEGPVHTVTVQPFRLGKHEVTFAQWDACVADGGCGGYRPTDYGLGRGNRPVIGVSWDEILSFINWLNSRTGGGHRLPTEAEWEYAARAGSTTEFSWGNNIGSNRANCNNDFCGDFYKYTAPVGSFAPNAWGLHDMHGNVGEWVQDCWNDGYVGAPSDGSAWESGNCSRRVVRGSSWNDSRWSLRSAHRNLVSRSLRRADVGFRLAQDL